MVAFVIILHCILECNMQFFWTAVTALLISVTVMFLHQQNTQADKQTELDFHKQ
jgi:hypothetical protein